MSTYVRYHLDKRKGYSEYSLLVSVSVDKKRIKFSTGLKLSEENWNQETQKAVPPRKQRAINDLLESYRAEIKEKVQNFAIAKIDVSKENLTQELSFTKKKAEPEPEAIKERGFFDYYADYEKEQSDKSIGTKKKVKTIKHLLQDLALKIGEELTFEKFDTDLYLSLKELMVKDRKYLNGTSNRYLKQIKSFLNWASKKGFNQNQAFRDYKSIGTDVVQIIALNADDLKTLSEFSGSDKLNRVRDMFLFQCYTGLRFSDMQDLRKSQIKKGFIEKVIVKTDTAHSIPLIAPAQKIADKYLETTGSYLFPRYSNQKYNSYLKDLGAAVEFDEEIEFSQKIGRRTISTTKPKSEVISSHTARRTFVTMSLKFGLSAEEIMQVTGHKDYSSFKKYVSFNKKEETKKRLEEKWNDL